MSKRSNKKNGGQDATLDLFGLGASGGNPAPEGPAAAQGARSAEALGVPAPADVLQASGRSPSARKKTSKAGAAAPLPKKQVPAAKAGAAAPTPKKRVPAAKAAVSPGKKATAVRERSAAAKKAVYPGKAPVEGGAPAPGKEKVYPGPMAAADSKAAPGEEEVYPGKVPASGRKRAAARPGSSAEQLATKQREISISEFFTKNRHLLGFDNPAKALLTTIKEAVDNSLDACEEAGVLPAIRVEVIEITESRFKVIVEDNGPGIVRAQVPKIFGKLLYGSKFHTLKQSRGQQGIGISAAGMYGQLTTGKPVLITSRTGPRAQAQHFAVKIDTKRNEPVTTLDTVVEWDVPHGTRVEIELEATYKRGRRSIDDYLALTAVANPHLELSYREPGGEEIRYPRVSESLPHEALAIKPHPYGVELGILMGLLSDSKARNLRGFLMDEFSRVGGKIADEIIEKAMLVPAASPKKLSRDQAELLLKGIAATKIMSPPTNCLSPIGEAELAAGLAKVVQAEFYAAVSRKPSVYRGNPFLVEAALAYGVEGQAADDLAVLHRFANRVPLLYQQGACAVTKSVMSTAWKGYGLAQAKGALPSGPLVLAVHIASAWVPFTSESKEAVAPYPEIVKEIKLALQECGRQLGVYIRRGKRMAEAQKKKDYIQSYIPHIGEALREILGLSEQREKQIVVKLTDTLEKSRKI